MNAVLYSTISQSDMVNDNLFFKTYKSFTHLLKHGNVVGEFFVLGHARLFIEHGVLSSLIMDYVCTGTIFLHFVDVTSSRVEQGTVMT